MLRFEQEKMKELMDKRKYKLALKYPPETVEFAHQQIKNLLAKTDRDLMRAFTGETGGAMDDYRVLDEAFLVITNFLHEQEQGNCPDFSDLQREVWFRKFLCLPPMVISDVHTS